MGEVRLNFPLCLNKDLDEKVSEIVGTCCDYILRGLVREKIKAIILVGSFSRGEGIAFQSDGALQFLSDIEFWIVAEPGEFEGLQNRVDFFERIIERNMGLFDHRVKVSLGFTTKNHLKRLKPYIFTVETKRFGKVLWGDRDILNFIPDYSEKDIEPLDGFLLLNNRIVEQMILRDKILEDRGIYRYEIDKGYIQIVNSLLTFHGRYGCLYPQKSKSLQQLYLDNNYLKEKIPDLLVKSKKILNSGEISEESRLAEFEALGEWESLRGYFKAVWLYEASNLMKDNSFDLEKISREFVSIPSLKNRLKGWIKVVLNPYKMRLFSLIDIVSGYLRTSPQFLIYQSAVKEYFNDEMDLDKRRKIIQQWEITVS